MAVWEEPYFFRNTDWYIVDETKHRIYLTDKAPQKAIDSYNEWMEETDEDSTWEDIDEWFE